MTRAGGGLFLAASVVITRELEIITGLYHFTSGASKNTAGAWAGELCFYD
ncbi:MAG: hypothetical protein ABSH08_11905 [Tepidisphaeraceae bacterium]